jgi:MHS family shikimate/dehydroshikimate transporter-like MFS transporter
MSSPAPDEVACYSPAEARELRKAVLSAFFGALIEWYDFFLFGTAAALVFPKIFFPGQSAATGTMLAFATYAVGFFARPVGSVFFGHLGDKFGRKATLVWTLTLMGGSTFLIGCLPSNASAGILGPILLVVMRIGQGLAIGGEWGGAALLAVEHGHKSGRGLHGSWAQIGVPAGLLLANAAFWLASLPGDEFLMQWGWRICFWFGLVLTVSGLVIRKRVTESPLFAKVNRTGEVARNPLGEVLREQWRKVLLVIGVRFAENAGFYILTAYVLSYVKGRWVDSSKIVPMVQHAILIAAAVEVVTIPLWARLSDRWGRRKVCMLGNGLFALGAYPFFMAIDSQNEPLIWLAMVVMIGIIHGAMYAPQAAFFAELFPTKLRYSGASLGYGLTTPLAGGLAPFISAWLVTMNGGQPWMMCGYLAAVGLLSFFSVYFAKETHQSSLEH